MKYVVTDDEIYAWAVRHDLSFGGSSVDARAAFEDAQSFAQTLGEPMAVPDGDGKFDTWWERNGDGSIYGRGVAMDAWNEMSMRNKSALDFKQLVIDQAMARINELEGNAVLAPGTKLYTRSNAKAVEVDGVSRIAAERRRQIDHEGWSADHDAQYRGGVLAIAAACYSENAASNGGAREYFRSTVPTRWPWNASWWKPGKDDSNESRIRELEKAGALIAAEIDRLSTHDKTKA